MKTLLICTIGMRDLQIEEDGTLKGAARREVPNEEHSGESRPQTMREFGQDMLDRFDEVREQLQYPILGPALDQFSRITGSPPNRVALVVSDQDESIAKRSTDTCIAGEVLLRLLRKDRRLKGPGISTSIRLFPITKDPHFIDAVVDQIAPGFDEWDREYERIYLYTTGGTPAMATGLLLAGLDHCPEKVRTFYKADEGSVRAFDVTRNARIRRRRQILRLLVEQGRYAAAMALVPDDHGELDISPEARDALRLVLASADHRLAFNMQAAGASLGAALSVPRLPQPALASLEALRDGIPGLDRDDTPGLLRELYYNTVLKFEHGEYADFVVRLLSFIGSSLRWTLQNSGLNFDGQTKLVVSSLIARPDWASSGGIKEFAAACTSRQGGRESAVDPETYPNSIPTHLCLLAYFGKHDEQLRTVHRCAEQLIVFEQLRNECFAIHRFRPIGREDLIEWPFTEPEEIVPVLRTLYESTPRADLRRDPYELTRTVAEALLASH